MENVGIDYAKDHLEELIARAARGEDVRIVDAKLGTMRLLPETPATTSAHAPRRVTDTMPPFVPLKEPRRLGRLEGKIPPPPEGFFDPLTEEELKDWYGDGA
jgi:antitoxin (DNA-binding transcriptional repressor) of toxin-antitoxin stability system